MGIIFIVSRLKYIINILLYLSWGLPVFSQAVIFKTRRLVVEKDALGNYISDMVRDQKGFLWLATRNGMHRYDGNMFENFQKGSNEDKFSKNQVNCTYFSNNRLFVGTQRGIRVVNTLSYKYEKFNDSINRGNVVRSIYTDPSGAVYWISEDGRIRALKEDRPISAPLPGGCYNPQLTGEGNMIFCLTDSFFYVFDGSDLSVKLKMNVNQYSVTSRFVSVDKEMVLFVKGKKLFRFNRSSSEIQVIREFKYEVNDLKLTPYGLFTIENGNMVFFYDAGDPSGSGEKVDMHFNAPIYYSGMIYLKDQMLVRSTNGLFIIDINPRYFTTILQTYDSIGGYFYDPRGIAEYGDDIYLFSFPKIHTWNKKNNAVKRITTEERLGAHSVFYEKDTIWIGTEGLGLVKFYPRTREWKRIMPGPEEGTAHLGVIAVNKWGSDKFLLGSYSGLYQYQRGDDNLRKIPLDLPGWSIYQPFVEDVLSLNDGSFLIATNRGSFRIGKDLKLINQYSPKDGNTLSDQASAIILSPTGHVWIGTSNGLFCYNLSGNLITHMTTSSGLAGDRVASLLADKAGNIWVGTFSGLSCILAGSGRIINFYMDEGLPDNEFNHASARLLESGEIVMGTTKGFVTFDPAKCLQYPKLFSKVSLSKLEYGNVGEDIIIYDPTILSNQNIVLGKERNYAKLYFRHGEERYLENVDFDYLIKGIHENWQSAGSEDFIQLIDLRPGNYTLKVRMIYAGSNIESSMQVFNLQVREYFYKTIWFYMLMAAIISLLVIFYLRSLLIRERKIKELRTMLSRNLHDEVGSYLTGISMNVDMIRKKTSGISEYQQSISDLSRKALAALKDGLWSLDRESDTGQHFWDRVKVIAKESFEPLEIDYSINAPKDLSKIRLGIIQKNQLIYVIKECFTNAMKYGRGNAVSINWDLSEGNHRIVIRNRKADDVIRSGGMLGIDNIRYRMSELGGASVLEDTAQEFSVILYLYFIK